MRHLTLCPRCSSSCQIDAVDWRPLHSSKVYICLQPSEIHTQDLFSSCQKLLESVALTLKVDSFLTRRRTLEKRCIEAGPFTVPKCTEYGHLNDKSRNQTYTQIRDEKYPELHKPYYGYYGTEVRPRTSSMGCQPWQANRR